MKNKTFYQDDFPELERVVPEGCLFMSLIDIVSEELQFELTRKDIISIYTICNDRDIIGLITNKKELGAFVWDHTGVLDIASIVCGRKDIKWEYLARIYQPQEVAKGRTTFTYDNRYYENATALIYQVRTSWNTGHFQRMKYNPLKNGSIDIALKSVRYYRCIRNGNN